MESGLPQGTGGFPPAASGDYPMLERLETSCHPSGSHTNMTTERSQVENASDLRGPEEPGSAKGQSAADVRLPLWGDN